jgi:ATP-dependent helicase/nuclease subunit B
MGVRFVLGRAGTGKSRWCFDQIMASLRAGPLGPAIFWIVPRQATFQAERLLACDGKMGGYFRVRVVSFEDLGREILLECGGNAAAQVSDLGRRMILGHLLRKLQPKLKYFHAVAHQPGVAAELDATFSELHRCDQNAGQIAQNLDQLNPALAAKLHDLALLHHAYSEFLGGDKLDPQKLLAEALAAVERCQSLRQAQIFVDGFYDFTQHQRRVLAGLARVCPEMSITLCVDPKSPSVADPHKIPPDLSLFHKTEEAYRRLWFVFNEEKIALEKPVLLSVTGRFSNAALSALEAWTGSSAAPTGDAIQMIAAPDRRAEVDAAARWIRQWVGRGHRYRDVAVLMRSEEDYRDLIDASFREHGIPFFADRRRSAAHHPLLRLIRSALAVAKQNYSHDSMMAILKTGLVGLNSAETDTLENYVLLHGIAHGTWITPEPWSGRRRPVDESEEGAMPAPTPAQIADGLRRRVVEKLIPFVNSVTGATRPRARSSPSPSTLGEGRGEGLVASDRERGSPHPNPLPEYQERGSEGQKTAVSVRDLANAVFNLLEAFGVRAQIVAWMKNAEQVSRLEERGEHESVWKELIKLFDELVGLFGDERISLDDFIAILDSALEGFDVALAPPTVDQVLIGAVDRTRTPPLAACVVLGLSEGQFPRASSEDTVFSDADRRALSAKKIDLDPDTQRRLLDESFWGYIAFTRASGRLLLTRSISDAAGRPAGPSPLWLEITGRFPNITVESAPRGDDLALSSIGTPRQLITALMRWVRAGASQNDDLAGVYQWLAGREMKSDAIDTVRYRAWKALSHEYVAHLSPRLAAEIFVPPLNVTIGQLESFAGCPFQHFARFGLGLKDRARSEVSGADLSQVYHDVLEKLVGNLIRSRQAWSDLDKPALQQSISELTAQLGAQLRDQLMLSTARNRFLLDHIEQTLHRVAASQKAAAERGEFRAAFTNVRFGAANSKSAPPTILALAVTTPKGNQVTIRGKIDRVDILPDGSASVVDYRMSAARLDAARAYHGLSLQLLTYLLVLEKNGRHLTRTGETGPGQLAPAAAFCVQLLRWVESKNPEDALSPDDPLFPLRVRPRGIFDSSQAGKFDKNLVDGSSEVVSIFIRKDGQLGRRSTTDAVLPDEFAAIMAHIERRIGELADRIVSGDISIRPSRIGRSTPCPHCEFRDLCRFEPSPGGYLDLPPMNREEMLARVMEGKSR